MNKRHRFGGVACLRLSNHFFAVVFFGDFLSGLSDCLSVAVLSTDFSAGLLSAGFSTGFSVNLFSAGVSAGVSDVFVSKFFPDFALLL